MSAGQAPARLRDAHVHLFEHGDALSCVRLGDCSSADECLERVAAAVATGRGMRGGWVRAIGARVVSWAEPRWPTKDEIDNAAGGRPCFIRSFDLHAAAVGGRGLSAIGVDRHTPDAEGGVIVRGAGGEPTGVMLERACGLLWRALPAPDECERLAALRLSLADFCARGFVEVHDMFAQEWLGPTLARLLDERDPAIAGMRILLYPPLERLEAEASAAKHWSRPRALELAGGKIFLDGTLSSRTAWMLEEYPEPIRAPGLPRGQHMFSDEQLAAAIARSDALGLPLAMHAIGDFAVRQGLDALERTRPKSKGWRIEHCQFVAPQDSPRFGHLGVIASPQPCHLLADIEALAPMGSGARSRAWPLREIHDGFTRLGLDPAAWMWFGSDAPVMDPDPATNLRAAVERRREGAPASAAVAPEQALTRPEAEACMLAATVIPA